MNTERIISLAKAQGKTITHLCELLGKKRGYLGDVRRDNLKLSEEALSTLAADLGTTPEYLAYQTDDPSLPGSDDLESENVVIYHRNGRKATKRLTPNQMKMMIRILDAIDIENDDL